MSEGVSRENQIDAMHPWRTSRVDAFDVMTSMVITHIQLAAGRRILPLFYEYLSRYTTLCVVLPPLDSGKVHMHLELQLLKKP